MCTHIIAFAQFAYLGELDFPRSCRRRDGLNLRSGEERSGVGFAVSLACVDEHGLEKSFAPVNHLITSLIPL